jgi:hypothetical protein
MVGGTLGAAGVLALGYGIGKSTYEYSGANTNDPTEREGLISPWAARTAHGVFSGENMLLNIGAGLGGMFGGNMMMKSAMNDPSMRGAIHRMSGAAQTIDIGQARLGVGNDPMLRQGAAAQQLARARKARPTGFLNRIFGRGARRGNISTLEYLSNDGAKVDSGRLIQHNTGGKVGSARATAALTKAGASAGAMKRLRTGAGLRRFGSMAMWAPLAFMGFDMVASSLEMSAPGPPREQPDRPFMGGTFMDSDQAFTQRRRALQVIHDSQYSGRAGLGNEASLVHR